MWGCKAHWFKLPAKIRRAIWRAYRPGQEDRMDPSPHYLAAAPEASDWIGRMIAEGSAAEGPPPPEGRW